MKLSIDCIKLLNCTNEEQGFRIACILFTELVQFCLNSLIFIYQMSAYQCEKCQAQKFIQKAIQFFEEYSMQYQNDNRYQNTLKNLRKIKENLSDRIYHLKQNELLVYYKNQIFQENIWDYDFQIKPTQKLKNSIGKSGQYQQKFQKERESYVRFNYYLNLIYQLRARIDQYQTFKEIGNYLIKRQRNSNNRWIFTISEMDVIIESSHPFFLTIQEKDDIKQIIDEYKDQQSNQLQVLFKFYQEIIKHDTYVQKYQPFYQQQNQQQWMNQSFSTIEEYDKKFLYFVELKNSIKGLPLKLFNNLKKKDFKQTRNSIKTQGLKILYNIKRYNNFFENLNDFLFDSDDFLKNEEAKQDLLFRSKEDNKFSFQNCLRYIFENKQQLSKKLQITVEGFRNILEIKFNKDKYYHQKFVIHFEEVRQDQNLNTDCVYMRKDLLDWSNFYLTFCMRIKIRYLSSQRAKQKDIIQKLEQKSNEQIKKLIEQKQKKEKDLCTSMNKKSRLQKLNISYKQQISNLQTTLKNNNNKEYEKIKEIVQKIKQIGQLYL